MVQARQTGRKTRTTKKKKARSSMPWGMLFIALVSGTIIGVILMGYFFDRGEFGQGLKNYPKPSVSKPNKKAEKTIEQVPVRTEKTYEFYGMLEGTRDRILPDDFSIEQTDRQKKEYYYVMQIATLSSQSSADALRAKLAFKGFETKVEQKTGKFRIKMGPYKDRRSLKNARNKIKNAGFGLNPIGIQYRKKES